MVQYIDKATIVAEIKRRIQECDNLANTAADNNLSNTLQANELLIRQYKSLLYFLDTLETKEVDLEKEIDNYIDTKEIWEIQEAPLTSIENAAIHFFELGLKAQKGEQYDSGRKSIQICKHSKSIKVSSRRN